jgi:hypothetical protein
MSQDREPHQDLNVTHNHGVEQESFDELNATPEPLYRLRVEVLKDEEGSRDCPLRMFVRSSYLLALHLPRSINNLTLYSLSLNY